MGAPIGFVVLSHSEPALLRRLLSALEHTYRGPPIVVHHDFTQCALPEDAGSWAADVQFVRPHVRTSWSHFSVVDAFLAGHRLLHRSRAPDWFVLISGTDYPVRPGAAVVAELTAGGGDLYMDLQPLEPAPAPLTPLEGGTSRMGTERSEWRRMAYDRYVARSFRYPSLTKRLRPTRRHLTIRSETALGLVNPFSPELRCHAGDHWFTGNQTVARLLIEAPDRHPALFQHYSTRFCPEESIYHTILGSARGLRIVRDNKRYTDWSEGRNHPKVLEHGDLDPIVRSGCHFARKMSPTASTELLDALDGILQRA